MVLCRDLHPPPSLIQNGLVDAPVTLFGFVGLKTQRPAKELVSETDSKERESVSQCLLKDRDLVIGGRRVTGPV